MYMSGESESTHPCDWNSWGYWRSNLPAVTDIGKPIFEWALTVHEEFFGNEWFSKAMEARGNPLMNIWEWPLSNPMAVVFLLERACRIALLEPSVRNHVGNLASKYTDSRSFGHLEVILEVAGFAIRDQWGVVIEVEAPNSSNKVLDIQLQGFRNRNYTIEVTTRGKSRELLKNEVWWNKLSWKLLDVFQIKRNLHYGGHIDRELDESEIDNLLLLLSEAADVVIAEHKERTVTADSVEITIYPTSYIPDNLTFTGPQVTKDNAWESADRRLKEKAKQTQGTYDTWIVIEEGSGLFMFTKWAHYKPDEQLFELSQLVRNSVADYPHVKGVIVTTGFGIDMQQGNNQFTIRPMQPEGEQSALAVESVLPYSRRRRTFIIPIGRSNIILPQWYWLHPEKWYENEPSWLDWALNKLSKPSLSEIIQQLNIP